MTDTGGATVHGMRTHARWIVDSTWLNYQFDRQDTSTVGLRVSEFASDTYSSGTISDIDLFGDTTHIQINNESAKLEYPRSMNTGYNNLDKPVVGVATLSLKDKTGDEDLTPMVGRHVVMNVSAFIDSTTPFDSSKTTVFEVDVGKILVGAIWLSGPTLQSGSFSRRISGVVSGLLVAAVSGLWTVKLSWGVHHKEAIANARDNFLLHLDVQVFGYYGTRALLIVES